MFVDYRFRYEILIRKAWTELFLEHFNLFFREIGDFREGIRIASLGGTPFSFIFFIELCSQLFSDLLIDLDLMVSLLEGLRIKLFKVFLQFFERSFLDDVVAIKIDYGQKSFFDNLKASMSLKFLPNKYQVGKVQHTDKHTQ